LPHHPERVEQPDQPGQDRDQHGDLQCQRPGVGVILMISALVSGG
jgi:hypothetical protein